MIYLKPVGISLSGYAIGVVMIVEIVSYVGSCIFIVFDAVSLMWLNR